jgi:hypothetical protein
MEEDLLQGEELVAPFRLFLEDLVAFGLAPKTIQRHADDLWALVEQITDRNKDRSLEPRVER